MATSHLSTEGKSNPEMSCGTALNVRQTVTHNWMSQRLSGKYNKKETYGQLIE
jgi:hypothetical protein